jgi:hypothetical protein
MDKDVRVATDRGCEMGVEWLCERVVAILGDIEHTSAEVLGAMHGLGAENLE